MRFLDLFALAFQDGCGVSLDEAMSSPELRELTVRQRELPQIYSPRTHRGIALRRGHQQMGNLLNTLPEGEALKQAQTLAEEPNELSVRALIQYLGDSLINTAIDCLPDGIEVFVERWKSGDPAEQIRVAGELYELFISPSQDVVIMNEENLEFVKKRRSELRRNHSSASFMPKLFGKWGQGGSPNCIGKSFLLAAFARLANARCYTADDLISIQDLRWDWSDVIKGKINFDISERGLEVDGEFARTMAVNERYDVTKQLRDSFHSAVVLQLSDKRWVLIDSHGLSWGVLPSSWRMEEVDRLLSKYGEVLPGLSVMAHDGGAAEEWFRRQQIETDELLARSRRIEELVTAAGDDPQAVIEAMPEEEINFLATDAGLPMEMLKDVNKRMLIYLLIGAATDTSSAALFHLDSDFRRQKIHSLLTYYHYLAYQGGDEKWRAAVNAGELPNPASEFSNAPFSLAIAVLNSLSLDCHSFALNQFFADNMFSQMTLHNSLLEIVRSPLGYSEAAAQSECILRNLSILHPASRQILAAVERLRFLRCSIEDIFK